MIFMSKKGLTRKIFILLIIAIAVIGVITFFSVGEAFPAVERSLENLFGFKLTPSEIEAQENANLELENNLLPILNSCAALGKSGCFCTDESVSFPNGYQLVFSLDTGNTKLYLKNDDGGKLSESERFVLNAIPCIYTGGGFKSLGEGSEASITFGSSSILFYGGEEIGFINPGRYIYKLDKDHICFLIDGLVEVKSKGVCD